MKNGPYRWGSRENEDGTSMQAFPSSVKGMVIVQVTDATPFSNKRVTVITRAEVKSLAKWLMERVNDAAPVDTG